MVMISDDGSSRWMGTSVAQFKLITKLLQLKDLRVDQCEEPYIRVNIRELNRELCTGLSTLYTETPWSVLLYF